MPGAWTTHDWYVFHAFALFLTNPCFENDKFNTIMENGDHVVLTIESNSNTVRSR